MADPGHEGLLRAVAAIGWMGGQVITGAADDEAQVLTTLREQLNACRVTWETRGFAPAFRRLLAESGARAKLLRRPDGERALTNLLHLGQLLHTAADSEGRGVGSLLSWFARHLNGDGVTTDEQLLRLERDDEAVQIVTMHRSKGLEYDVVFCPFCWEGESNDQRLTRHGLQVHDADAHERRLHLGPDFTDELKAQRRREELAENLRLFYVALTRAKRRCYVAWGALKAAETSAPAWLLHRDKATGQPWPVSFSALSDDAMCAELQALAQAAKLGKQTTIAVESLPKGEGPAFQSSLAAGEALAARTFTRRIADNWRVLAFTAMTSGADTEAPDYDGGSRPAEIVAPTGMFAFPAGTRAGTCLHKIFERIDFPSAIQEPPREIIAEELRAHGLDATKHADAVTEMLAEVLASELPGVGGTFQLAEVTATDRLNELGFHCPLRDVNAQRVAEVLKRHGNELPASELPARIEELQFAASGGLLTGFIDLLVRRGERFYLLDWKSNWLGNAVTDYIGDKLTAAMLAHRYPLQYLLYTVALNRWLTLRLGKSYSYERSFGGVFYVFLRGVNRKQPGAGVFADRPSQALIEDLSDALLAPPAFGGIAL
jgi:exodeoxyribonuclease V beta subunit